MLWAAYYTWHYLDVYTLIWYIFILVEEGAKPGDTNKEHDATIEGLKLENNRLRMKLASVRFCITLPSSSGKRKLRCYYVSNLVS